MSKINYYSNEEQFANNFVYASAERPSIHYVGGPKRAYFHKSTKKADFLDVVMSNASGSILLVPGSELNAAWKTAHNGYLPDGVVVIPSSVLPDGRARMMSLTEMSKITPASGVATEGEREYMKWGKTNVDIPGLKNFNQVPCISSEHEEGEHKLERFITHVNTYAFLPSDKHTGDYEDAWEDENRYNTFDMCDGEPKSVYAYDDNDCHAPSPFTLIDQTNRMVVLNGLYSAKSYRNTGTSAIELIANPLSDFEGFENNQIILNFTTDSDYEAFLMTRQFHTRGTSAGSWYVPAMGELGFLMPRFEALNDLLGTIETLYGSDVNVLPLGEGNYYWSSSEIDDRRAYNLHASGGYVGNDGKDNDGYVRAFAFLPNA